MAKYHSSGYIKEVAILGTCLGLLSVGQECSEGKYSDDYYTPYNVDYATDKRINRRIEKLRDEITTFIKSLDEVTRTKAYEKQKSVLLHLQGLCPKMIQPDALAVMLLWYRFQGHERTKPLHDDFKQFAKDSELFGIIELLENTPIANNIETMDKLAKDIANF